jgi:uncharacterized membrane protein YjgN (DUF898 family)
MNEQEIKVLPFRFSGNGDEYFKIWIVNLILSVLTLGIYSAWAKVRNNRYFYGNTLLENSAFEYHATPMTILKGRLIAVAALVVYVFVSKLFPIVGLIFLGLLTIIIPWIIWRSIQFNARIDPIYFANMFEKMVKKESSDEKYSEFLSTHPPSPRSMQQAREYSLKYFHSQPAQNSE